MLGNLLSKSGLKKWNLVDTISKQTQHLVLTITDTLKLLIISITACVFGCWMVA
jgi:hypothetical protein